MMHALSCPARIKMYGKVPPYFTNFDHLNACDSRPHVVVSSWINIGSSLPATPAALPVVIGITTKDVELVQNKCVRVHVRTENLASAGDGTSPVVGAGVGVVGRAAHTVALHITTCCEVHIGVICEVPPDAARLLITAGRVQGKGVDNRVQLVSVSSHKSCCLMHVRA
jgi:hypothetical protein